MSTDIEFYQRLSEHLPEEAAKLIAERTAASRLEVKIDALTAKVDSLVEHGATKVEVERLRSSFFRWNLAFFVPLWVGTYATLITMVLRGSP